MILSYLPKFRNLVFLAAVFFLKTIYIIFSEQEINEINGSLSVTAQWFYRPEEAQKEGGGDPRELLYSFHLDEVAAESVMHTCVVHFIPQHKQVPSKKEHPGFIVQQVYDHKEDKFHELTDTDYKDTNQQEIDLLVMKTVDRIGELLDRDPEDIPGGKSDNLPRGGLKKRPLKHKDVRRDAPAGRSKHLIKEDTAGNYNLNNRAILSRYKALTGNESRDKWLDKYVDTILALPHSENVSSISLLYLCANIFKFWVLFARLFLVPIIPHDSYSDEQMDIVPDALHIPHIPVCMWSLDNYLFCLHNFSKEVLCVERSEVDSSVCKHKDRKKNR
jgi:hypothetical protein